MKNQSVSDFVAATMDAVLNSKEHKSLFDVQYKYAQDMNDAKKGKCSDCDKDKESCSCDSSMADDNDARKAKKDDEDSSMAWDDNDARKKKDEDSDSSDADDNDAKKKKDSDSDSSSADDLESSAAFDVAIDSLLTASAALDSVGRGRGSAFCLKLASLVVEAKKKDKKEKDSKKKDSQSAKDKKSDSKKSDSKDSKKSNPFAKKK